MHIYKKAHFEYKIPLLVPHAGIEFDSWLSLNIHSNRNLIYTLVHHHIYIIGSIHNILFSSQLTSERNMLMC